MPDEITILISGKVDNGNFTERFQPGSKRYDQSTPESAAGTVNLTSDSTVIPLDSVDGEAGWCFMTVVTTAMDCLVGPTSDNYLLRLPPESSHVFHLTSDTTLAAQTTANSAILQYLVLQV